MGACFNLPEDQHTLLRHLTETKRTRRRNGHSTLIVRDDMDAWIEALDGQLDPETIRLAYEDLVAFRYLRKGPQGMEINEPCACVRAPALAGLTPAVSKPQAESTQRGGGLRSVAPPPYYAQGSALQMTRSEGVSEEQALEDFLNGAPADEPAPAPSARDLVDFFLQRVPAQAKRQGIRLMPTTISAKALGGQIRRMLNEGMTPDEVRAMIILFAKQYGRFHKAEADPAKVFLANRRRLFKQCQEQTRFSVERDPERLAKKAEATGRRYSTPADMAAARR